MSVRFYKPAIWLMWLALPITAFTYWRAWDLLPLRMAVHFDVNWQPNGYTSREGSLMLSLGVEAFLLLIFTVAAHAVGMNKPSAAWPVLISFYLALGLFCFVSSWIVQRNLTGEPPHALLVRSDFQRSSFPTSE
jgi:Protein of unknown function (DUF1648)